MSESNKITCISAVNPVMRHSQGWTGGAGGPFRVMGLYGSAGFSGGTSGDGSGSPRPSTISSMFKISESILKRSLNSPGVQFIQT